MRRQGGRSRGPFFYGFAGGCLLLLVLVEASLRTGLVEFADPRARVIRDALFAKNPAAAFGDSHVANRPNLGGRMHFAGFGGATLYEVDRVIAQYYRWIRPERVIVEVGPQMFARYRQKEWAGLTPGTFSMQVLPFPLAVLEPALIAAFMESLAPTRDERPPLTARMNRDQRAYMKLRALHGDGTWEAASDDLRRRLVSSRVKRQTPVRQLRKSIAWRSFLQLLGRLEALGAEACIVVAPVTEGYERLADGRYSAAVDHVRAEVEGRGMTFKHYAELGLALTSRHFLNQDHLNAAGRRRFWPKVYDACFSEADPDRLAGSSEIRR